MWSWWLGVSRVLPSQHLDQYVSRDRPDGGQKGATYEAKWWTVMMPPLQGFVGKSGSSGKRVPLLSRHTNRRPAWPLAAASVVVEGLPTVIRKP